MEYLEEFRNRSEEYIINHDLRKLRDECVEIIEDELADRASGRYEEYHLVYFMQDWNERRLDALTFWRDSENIDEWLDAMISFAERHQQALIKMGILPHDWENMSGDVLANAAGKAIADTIDGLLPEIED